MQGRAYRRACRNTLAISVLSLFLNGCLMGEPETNDANDPSLVVSDNEISGSIGDGPVVGAMVRIIANDGSELVQLESDTSAGYNITVRTQGKYYPLQITAENGVDLVTNQAPDFELIGAALAPGKKTVANVNPFSTMTYELASDLAGGINKSNVEAAQQIVTSALSFGLTTLIQSGPMSTPIDGSNIAEMVWASESFGETVRRTRDTLVAFGNPVNGDQVMQRLASDLTDRIVDGAGGPRSDPRTAAVAILVSTQVVLESMAHQLRVNGSDATPMMNAAINRVLGGSPEKPLADLRVTAGMLATAMTGLIVADELSQDTRIAELRSAVAGLQAGMDPLLIRSLLPSDYRSTLDNFLSLVAGGTLQLVEQVNQVARDGGTGTVANRAPVITGTPPSSVIAGGSYAFTPAASDPDNDTLSFAGTGVPGWASIDPVTGVLSGTPGPGDVGTYQGIAITVSDGQLSDTLGPFTISVTASNAPPAIGGTPGSEASVGVRYTFTPSASDPDNDTLSFTGTGVPGWASVDPVTGVLRGTPGAGDVGAYQGIAITVSDGELSDTLGPFTITVSASNRPPVISGTPITQASVGVRYTFTPSASDPDNDTLSFAGTGVPGWASVDPVTGSLTGTPAAGDVGVHENIIVSVSDGEFTSSLAAFSITVTAVNSPPSITGSVPATVEVGAAYEFLPVVTDPDGDPLTLSIESQPAWLDFEPATGALTGTPSTADVGIYGGIVITVSDGIDSATLGPFAIEVVDTNAATGSVTLNWTAPTQNEDGTALTDLAGYRIYWGTTSGVYPNVVAIDNPGITTYVIDNLAPGTYEFVATSVNAAGIESAFSNAAVKTVNP